MAILGWIVGGIGALVVAALSALFLIWLFDRLIARIEARGEARQFARDMERLRLASHWFSEDEPTKMLIAELAIDGMDTSRVRENWRLRVQRDREEPR